MTQLKQLARVEFSLFDTLENKISKTARIRGKALNFSTAF